MKSTNKLCQEVSSKLSMLDSKRKTINRCKGSKEVSKKNIGNYENVRFQRKENGKISYMIQCSKKSYEGSEYCWKHDNSGKTTDFTTLEKVVESITKTKEPVEKKPKSHEPSTLRIIVSKELKNRIIGINIRIEKKTESPEERSSPVNFIESSLDLDPGDDSEPEVVAESEIVSDQERSDTEIVSDHERSDTEEAVTTVVERETTVEESDTEEPVAESEDDEGMDVSQILTQDGEEYYLNDSSKVVYSLDDDGDGVEIGILTKVSDNQSAFLYDGEYYAVFDKGTRCVVTKRSYKKTDEGYICK